MVMVYASVVMMTMELMECDNYDEENDTGTMTTMRIMMFGRDDDCASIIMRNKDNDDGVGI